mmetsp:Transcript_87454/g.174653  ORF Transcript_87454/g.174653 Transcript_87454/m.174653 type:complete len:205 (-) Transcript_87454:255-869(-)
MPEARVQQMEHRMLGTTHVEVDRQPRLLRGGGPCALGVGRVGKAQVVPARTCPLWHRVRLSRVPLAVTLEEAPIEDASEDALRVGARLEIFRLWQLDRQFRFVDWYGRGEVDRVRCARAWVTALLMDLDWEVDRDGLTPVALAGKDPIAQLVIDRALALASFRQPTHYLHLRLRGGQSVQPLTRINAVARLDESLLERCRCRWC